MFLSQWQKTAKVINRLKLFLAKRGKAKRSGTVQVRKKITEGGDMIHIHKIMHEVEKGIGRTFSPSTVILVFEDTQ